MTKAKFTALSLAAWFLFVAASAAGYAQAPAAKPLAANVQEARLTSKLMGRDMPYRVVLPKGYNDGKGTSPRYPVVYLLHGLTGHYSNWTDRTKVAELALGHNFIIVTPEGDNGWYSDSVTTATNKYESYIVSELVPQIDARYRTLADREHRVIAGLSMGGYGSLKFGLKYPQLFSLVGSFSGALGATDFDRGISESEAPNSFFGIVRASLTAAFGPPGGEARKANDIFGIVRGMSTEQLKSLPYVYQSCGTEDPLIQNNRDFMALILEKKIPHEYRQHPGGHDWTFWDEQIREFLNVAEQRVKK